MKELKEKFLLGKLIYLMLSLSLLVGFYFDETASGAGAAGDFYKTWGYVLALKNSLFVESSFWGVHFPLHYIILSKLNFLIVDKDQLRFFYCILSLIVPFLFYLNLKIKFNNMDKNLLLIFASVLFILPTFRYTAIWANNQMTALIFLLISTFFFLKWFEEKKGKINLNLILQILFMTLAVYTRQDYIIFFLYFMIVYIQKIKFKEFLALSIFVSLLTLPGFWFIYQNPHTITQVKFTYEFQNFLLVNSSIMSLYLIPIFFCLIINNIDDFKKEIKFFVISSIFFTVLVYIFSYSFYYNYILGGGFMMKLSLLLFNNYFLFYISSILGFIFLTYLAKGNINDLIIILLLLFGYFASMVFQKYFEPLFIFIFFLLLQSGLSNEFLKNYKNILYLYTYFIIYLASAIFNDLFQLTKNI